MLELGGMLGEGDGCIWQQSCMQVLISHSSSHPTSWLSLDMYQLHSWRRSEETHRQSGSLLRGKKTYFTYLNILSKKYVYLSPAGCLISHTPKPHTTQLLLVQLQAITWKELGLGYVSSFFLKTLNCNEIRLLFKES